MPGINTGNNGYGDRTTMHMQKSAKQALDAKNPANIEK